MTDNIRSRLQRRLAATCATVTLCIAISQASAQEIVNNGTVLLAINPEGNLAEDSGGLTFVPTGGQTLYSDSWGLADGGAFLGATGAIGVSGAENLANAAVTATGAGATSNVDVIRGGARALTVQHAFAPSANSNLYRIGVRITNVGGTPITRLLYRRVADFDVPPTGLRDIMTIQGGEAATNVIGTGNEIFLDPDPTVPLQARNGIPLNTDFVDSGPDDQGASFDFDFGALANGQSAEFTIFYGAAASEADALAALAEVNGEVYALAQPDFGPGGQGPATGEPNTFILAFSGVGGVPVGPGAIGNDLLALIRDLGVAIARQHRRSVSLRLDGLDGGGAHRGAGYTPERGETAVDIYGIEGLRAFLNFHGSQGSADAHGNNAGYDFDAYSMNAGIDKSFDFGEGGFLGSAIVGLGVHVATGDATGTGGQGSAEVDGYGASLYGGIESNTGFYGDASIGYTRLNYDTSRNGLMTGFTGDTDADLITADMQIGYDFPARLAAPSLNRSFSAGPYASLSYAYIDVDGFTESNRGLTVGSFDSDRLDGEIGVRAQVLREVNGAAAFAKARIGYRHDLLADDETVALTTFGGTGATQQIDATDEHGIAVGVGLGAAVNDALTFSIEYDGLFGEDTTDHGILARARIALN